MRGVDAEAFIPLFDGQCLSKNSTFYVKVKDPIVRRVSCAALILIQAEQL